MRTINNTSKKEVSPCRRKFKKNTVLKVGLPQRQLSRYYRLTVPQPSLRLAHRPLKIQMSTEHVLDARHQSDLKRPPPTARRCGGACRPEHQETGRVVRHTRGPTPTPPSPWRATRPASIPLARFMTSIGKLTVSVSQPINISQLTRSRCPSAKPSPHPAKHI